MLDFSICPSETTSATLGCIDTPLGVVGLSRSTVMYIVIERSLIRFRERRYPFFVLFFVQEYCGVRNRGVIAVGDGCPDSMPLAVGAGSSKMSYSRNREPNS